MAIIVATLGSFKEVNTECDLKTQEETKVKNAHFYPSRPATSHRWERGSATLASQLKV